MAYSPSKHTASNKPYGTSNVPDGARSYFYDEANFVYRPYTSTSEVLSYLATSANRIGQFSVIVNTGGTLVNGVITGGTNAEYWFKDGTADGNLVLKSTDVSGKADISYVNTQDASTLSSANSYTDSQISTESSARATGDSNLTTNIETHKSRTDNPHSVSKTQVGLGNVDNTSDLNKPISTSTQTALNNKATDANVVHKTGAETIAGNKTFNNDIIANSFQAGASFNINQYTDITQVNGDSITVGIGTTSKSAYSWPSVTSSILETNIINTGISSTTLVKFTDGDNSAIDRLASITPNYVSTFRAWVSGYGVNDSNNVGGTFNATNFRNAYYTIIDTLVSKGWPLSKIVIFIPYINNTNSATINTLLQDIATIKGVVYSNVWQAMVDAGGESTTISGDGIHPNNFGASIIGKTVATSIGGTQYSRSIFSQEIVTPNRIITGKGIIGGNDNADGLELRTNQANGAGKISLFDTTYIKKSLIFDGKSLLQTIPDYIDFNNQYIASTPTATNLQLRLFTGTGLVCSTEGGLSLASQTGNGNRITSYNTHFFKTYIGLNDGGGATTAPSYIDFGSGSYTNVAATYSNSYLRFFTGTYIGVSSVDGFTFASTAANKISLKNDTYITGLISSTSNISVGTGLNGFQTTPAYIDLGSSIGSTPATNLKVRLYPNYGFSLSAGQLEYVAPASAAHVFYAGGERWRIDSTYNFTNKGSNGSAYLHLKAGVATASGAPIKLDPGTLLTSPEIGAIELTSSEFYYTLSGGRRTVVNTDIAQTLLNKTINGANNTLTVLAATQLSGITPVANGGSGVNTITGIIKGNGTSAFTTAVANTDYLPVNNAALTGTPTAPTAAAATNTTQIATTAFVLANTNKAARYTASGNGSSTSITVPHGLSGITTNTPFTIEVHNAASAGYSYTTIDATNVTVVYSVAPATGTNNLSYTFNIKP